MLALHVAKAEVQGFPCNGSCLQAASGTAFELLLSLAGACEQLQASLHSV